MYVGIDPVVARKRALQRSERMRTSKGRGRIVSIREHEKTNVGSAKTILRLMEKYRGDDRVQFIVLHDSTEGAKGAAKLVEPADAAEYIQSLDFDNLAPRRQETLDTEFKVGRVSEETYRGFKGNGPAQRTRWTAEQAVKGLNAEVARVQKEAAQVKAKKQNIRVEATKIRGREMNQIILHAAEFAAKKHRDQRRKDVSASPYINHPISVALIIADIGGVEDEEILAAALLHDTIEDTETSAEELESYFGRRVRLLVEEVTDDKGLPKEERKRKQIEHAIKLSPGASQIKLGDKICNVQDVTHNPPTGWSTKRRKEYLDWAENVIQNIPQTNEALEKRFREVIEQGRIELAIA